MLIFGSGRRVDLFGVQVKENMLHPNFKMVKNDEQLKTVLNKWSEGFVDRDNKFVQEFQKTFNSAFWELYLHASFKELGFQMDYSKETPDFIIKTKEGLDIVVEAVISNNAGKDTPEFDYEKKLQELETINDENYKEKYIELVQISSERIMNAISSKNKKYKETYEGLEYVKDKPFIIAVGSYEQPLFFLQGLSGILKACYGVEKAELVDDMPYFEYTEEIKKRDSTSGIPVGIFNNEDYQHISGILFSSLATVGKARALSEEKDFFTFFNVMKFNAFGPQAIEETTAAPMYHEDIFDGLIFCANPFAKNPINPEEVFNHDSISIFFNKEDHAVKHGALFSRMVRRISFWG